MSIVIMPSLKSSGKSWKLPGRNGLSQESSNEPGGGGLKFSNQVDSVEEQVESEEVLSSEQVELSLTEESEASWRSKLFGLKRESSVEITLSPSGAERSVILSELFS